MMALTSLSLTPNQIEYNERVERAMQRLIAARNKGNSLDAEVGLNRYMADITYARQITGAEHFMLVAAER